MKAIFYNRQKHCEISEEQARDVINKLTSSRKPTHIEINGELLKTAMIEVHSIEEGEKKPLKIWEFSTEDIKKELGDFEKFYKKYATGVYDYSDSLLFGEDKGIVKYLMSEGIIGEKDSKFTGVKFKYRFITNLPRFDAYERKSQLYRELQSRRNYAQKEEKIAQAKILIGRIVKTPLVKTASTGTVVANFDVATNEVYTDKQGVKQEAVSYHSIKAFNSVAEVIGKYCDQGKEVMIEGSLKTEMWTTDRGEKKYKTFIIANKVQMGGGGNGR